MKTKPKKKAAPVKVKPNPKMKAQLKAQLEKSEVVVPTPKLEGRHVWRMGRRRKDGSEIWACVLCEKAHVEGESTPLPTRPLEGCRVVVADRTRTETLPCMNCGEELTPMNRSILQDGRVVHIGCKRAPKEKPQAKPVLSGLPKHGKLKPPERPKAPPPSKYGDVRPCSDYQGRTCLQLARDVATVTYVALDTMGLHLAYDPVLKFDERFKPLMEGEPETPSHREYPVEKAVAHYVGFAKDYGATQDVLDFLGRVVQLKPEVAAMATKKLANKGGGSNGHKGAVKKTGGGGPKKPGSGQFIRDLLMKATPTDKILALVHKTFPGSKAKASDVAWNRGKLRAEGKKVPEVKG